MEFIIFQTQKQYICFFEDCVYYNFTEMPYNLVSFSINYNTKEITLSYSDKKYILIPDNFEELNFFLQTDRRIQILCKI